MKKPFKNTLYILGNFIAILLIPISIITISIAFRISLKSTSIFWLPLLWALRPPKPAHEPWPPHVRYKSKDDILLIATLVSALTIAMLAGKLSMLAVGIELKERIDSLNLHGSELLREFINAAVRPDSIPLWQIASLTNSVITIGIFLWLRRLNRRIEVNLPINDAHIQKTLSTTNFIRRILTTYTITANGIVFWHLAKKIDLPTIGLDLFPII